MLIEAINLIEWQNLSIKSHLPVVTSVLLVTYLLFKCLQWLILAHQINKINGPPNGYFSPFGNLYIMYAGMRLGWTPGESQYSQPALVFTPDNVYSSLAFTRSLVP